MKKPAKKTPAAPAKPAKAPVKKTVAAAIAPAPAKTASPARTAAPAKKKSASAEPPATFISAQIDIGFGNHLTIRGEGPGLSWDDGLVMDCVGPSLWTISLKHAASPVTFKVLVNDLTWNAGADYKVAPGQSVTIHPRF